MLLPTLLLASLLSQTAGGASPPKVFQTFARGFARDAGLTFSGSTRPSSRRRGLPRSPT